MQSDLRHREAITVGDSNGPGTGTQRTWRGHRAEELELYSQITAGTTTVLIRI